MALDGRGDLIIAYDRPTPKPGEVKYGLPEATSMEEDMVVMLHARSTDSVGYEKTDPDQERRL